MHASQRSQHAVLIQRLRQKIRPARSHRFLCRSSIRGDEDDRNIRERGNTLQPFVNEKTFRGGHVDVEQDEIGMLSSRDLDGLISIGRHNEPEVGSLHPGPDERAHIRVVVHQKDLNHVDRILTDLRDGR